MMWVKRITIYRSMIPFYILSNATIYLLFYVDLRGGSLDDNDFGSGGGDDDVDDIDADRESLRGIPLIRLINFIPYFCCCACPPSGSAMRRLRLTGLPSINECI